MPQLDAASPAATSGSSAGGRHVAGQPRRDADQHHQQDQQGRRQDPGAAITDAGREQLVEQLAVARPAGLQNALREVAGGQVVAAGGAQLTRRPVDRRVGVGGQPRAGLFGRGHGRGHLPVHGLQRGDDVAERGRVGSHGRQVALGGVAGHRPVADLPGRQRDDHQVLRADGQPTGRGQHRADPGRGAVTGGDGGCPQHRQARVDLVGQRGEQAEGVARAAGAPHPPRDLEPGFDVPRVRGDRVLPQTCRGRPQPDRCGGVRERHQAVEVGRPGADPGRVVVVGSALFHRRPRVGSRDRCAPDTQREARRFTPRP